jgi:hypothetical protein
MTHTAETQNWIGNHRPDAELFDLSRWPIVTARFPELEENNRVDRVLNGLDAILDQKTHYAIIWLAASHNHDEESHEDEKLSNKWIKKRKSDLNRFCRGYTYVVTDTGFREELESHLAVVNGRLFKFPMKIVEKEADAIEVARQMLADGPG